MASHPHLMGNLKKLSWVMYLEPSQPAMGTSLSRPPAVIRAGLLHGAVDIAGAWRRRHLRSGPMGRNGPQKYGKHRENIGTIYRNKIETIST